MPACSPGDWARACAVPVETHHCICTHHPRRPQRAKRGFVLSAPHRAGRAAPRVGIGVGRRGRHRTAPHYRAASGYRTRRGLGRGGLAISSRWSLVYSASCSRRTGRLHCPPAARCAHGGMGARTYERDTSLDRGGAGACRAVQWRGCARLFAENNRRR